MKDNTARIESRADQKDEITFQAEDSYSVAKSTNSR